MNKTILILAAHPDDEVLGCGGTIAHFAQQGANVHIVFFTDGVGARQQDKVLSIEAQMRKEAAHTAAKILGAQSVTFGEFPDNQMDSIDLLSIIKFAEKQIGQYSPEIILTHHAADLNIDHRLVSQAAVTACRPQPGHTVKTILFFEVPSSTEWQLPSSHMTFVPNWFVNIAPYIELRAHALEAYSEEMRSWPHSRSFKAVEHLARWRGASVGLEAAEAFTLGRNIITIEN